MSEERQKMECDSLFCNNCEFCCRTALKMYLDCHVLNERDNVGENYIAVWRIMYKIRHRKTIGQQIAFLKAQAAAKQEEVDSFPDDLQDLIVDWDNLPENKAGCQLTPLSDDAVQSVVAGLTEVAPKTSSTMLSMQQKDRALLFSRPIKVINPQQIKLSAQGLSNLKSINVRLGRVLPVKLTQKRSILQNRTNLPLVENNPGQKVTIGRGVKRDPTSTLIVPRFSSLLARGNPTLITPLAHVNQSRGGRPSLQMTPATSLLAANNAVAMHREFPPRQVPTQLKVAFIQCTPKNSESSGDVVGDDDSRKS
ncbi:hypothetical protein LSTR_LSTR006039 [Laodelphax striatellus]|uniref:Uncharacterized protein n=1 Tax=Laodelphax striatellus TaxID=195883 RepID=A0A482XNN8_LAOST|nr:hypothetical protein LSTR_LSTR006039 [Laodelphax striatellus]